MRHFFYLLLLCMLLFPSAGFASECAAVRHAVPTQVNTSTSFKVFKQAKLLKKVKQLKTARQKRSIRILALAIIALTLIAMFAVSVKFGLESMVVAFVFGGGGLLIVGIVLLVFVRSSKKNV